MEYVSDSCEHGRKRKPDWDDLQFLYSWDGTTHHTLRSMPVDDPDHRMCRMDYPKGAIICGCDHFNTFLV